MVRKWVWATHCGNLIGLQQSERNRWISLSADRRQLIVGPVFVINVAGAPMWADLNSFHLCTIRRSRPKAGLSFKRHRSVFLHLATLSVLPSCLRQRRCGVETDEGFFMMPGICGRYSLRNYSVLLAAQAYPAVQ